MDNLNDRERELLYHLASLASTEAIASTMQIQFKSVYNMATRVRQKLGIVGDFETLRLYALNKLRNPLVASA